MKNQTSVTSKNSPPKIAKLVDLMSSFGIGVLNQKSKQEINETIKNAEACIKKSEELLKKSRELVKEIKLKL